MRVCTFKMMGDEVHIILCAAFAKWVARTQSDLEPSPCAASPTGPTAGSLIEAR